MTLSAPSDKDETFEATLHLIPELWVGVSALHGLASTDVFMSFDTSADYEISTTANAVAHPCMSAGAGVNLTVGAQADFLGLFREDVGTSLYEHSFPLYQVRTARNYPIYSILSLFFLIDRKSTRLNSSHI